MLAGIRGRTTLIAVLVMTVALAIASLALMMLLQRSLRRNIDTRATLRLQDITATVETGQLPLRLAGEDEDSTVAQVVVGDRILSQSSVVRPGQRITTILPKGTNVVVRTIRHPPIADGAAEYRVAIRKVPTQTGPVTAYAAASTEPVSDTIHALRILLAVVAPLLVLIVGAMTWWFVGRTLAPVEAIRHQVAEISSTGLDKRVPEPATADEVQRLASTMNAMLDRLESARDRQRSFVSDAAHELRSPLATMRAELDVVTAHGEVTDTPLIERLGRCTRRMELLVEDLLLLATTQEQGAARRMDVDLDELLLRQVEHLRATSRHTLDVQRIDAARVIGDPDQLERAITNVLDNAQRHAVKAISISLSTSDHVAELIIADDGAGVPPEHRNRVFDRFTRVDDARSDPGGAGLGLAIARQVLEDHGGSIDLDDNTPGARFVIRLPLSSVASPT